MALGYKAINCVLHIMNVVRFIKVWSDHMEGPLNDEPLNGFTML